MDGSTDGKKTTLTREIPLLVLRGEVRADSIDVEKRTIDVTWTTGARVLRGFWDQYWEELSVEAGAVRLGRLNNGAPMLAAHDGSKLDSVLGVVEPGSATVDGKVGRATVRFSRAEDDPEADKVFRKVHDKIIRNISVGYRVHKLEKIEDGEGQIPVYRATDWEPYELSVVPMGADDGAGFRSAKDRATNPCIFTQRTERTSMDPEKTESKTATAAPATPTADPVDELVATARKRNAETAATAAAEASRAASEAAIAERERVTEIQSLVRMTKLGDEFAERLVKSGASIDKVREVVLRELARADGEHPISGHFRLEAGEDRREKFIRGASASIFARAGLIGMIAQAKESKHFAAQFRDVALEPGEFGSMRLIDIARAALEMRGVSTRGLYGEELVKRALQHRGEGAMNTTSDFTVLLEAAMGKVWLGAYATTPVTFRRWCGIKSVQDFRTASFFRPGSIGNLDALLESGEIKFKNIPDGEKATLTPSTKANLIGLTRKAIVNDDLGAFRDLGVELGRAGARTIEYDAFALVKANSGLGPTQADTHPLFYSTRANVGSAGAMSVDTWAEAAALMAAQTDPAGNAVLDLSPAVLLCPKGLGPKARQFNTSTADPTNYKNANVSNPVAGTFRDIIDTAQITGTRHYVLADPGQYPMFAVGFIDGQEAPVVESDESFRFDGVLWRIKLDYGVGVFDYRSGVTCPGA